MSWCEYNIYSKTYTEGSAPFALYHTDKDTYPTMYQSFEDRLRGKYLAKECCEKIREVYIYEGDAFPDSQNEKYYERSGTESYRRRYNESW